MTHGHRPAVHVAANMLEGIVYSNKWRLSLVSRVWRRDG